MEIVEQFQLQACKGPNGKFEPVATTMRPVLWAVIEGGADTTFP